MDDLTTMGWLPAWIIGAPLVLAIFDWLRTPKPARDRDRDLDHRHDTVRMAPMPAAQR